MNEKYYSHDITFCIDKCNRKTCERHASRIKDDIGIPHSVAHYKYSPLCPFGKAKETNKRKKENPNGENCLICNSELDEKGAGGIWDLAGHISEVFLLHDVGQQFIYDEIREYIEKQNYCCNCGKQLHPDE